MGLANGFSKIVSILGSGVILLTGPSLWNVNHAYPFILAAALGIASVLIGGGLVKESTDHYSKPAKITFDFVHFPSVMKLYMAVFFIFLSYGCITPFYVKYCTSQLGFSANTASLGLFVLTIVGALFAVPAGIISDRISRRLVLLIGTLIFAGGLAGASFVHTANVMYVFL